MENPSEPTSTPTTTETKADNMMMASNPPHDDDEDDEENDEDLKFKTEKTTNEQLLRRSMDGPPPPSAATATSSTIRRRRGGGGDGGRSSTVPSQGGGGKQQKRRTSITTMDLLSPSVRLATDESFRTRAMYAVLVAVFADAANTIVLGPNYPLMVYPDAHIDSFPTTSPFEFATADKFITMTAMFASATANLVSGKISDKIGRRTLILINLLGSVVASLGKYFTRHNFWTFCAFNFINGLFSSTPALSLGYVSDLYKDNRQKSDAGMGNCVAMNVIGRGCGALIPLAMPQYLFRPLFPVIFVTFFAAIIVYVYLPEVNGTTTSKLILNSPPPGKVKIDDDNDDDDVETNNSLKKLDDDDDADDGVPKTLHKPTLWNILIGAFADNVGSNGLVPMCLSPLMFTEFYANFITSSSEPIMSEQAYRWIYSMLPFVVVPAALITPALFKRYGPGLCCVVANMITAIVTILLLYIAISIEPPTKITFGIYVLVLYAGFPVTFISQLTTGPMLDRIAPVEKQGYVQGLNMAAQQYAGAITPFLLGLLSDKQGLKTCLWVAATCSIVAALINSPLIFNPRLFQKPVKEEEGKKPEEDEVTVDMAIDEDKIQRQLQQGDYVPNSDFFQFNIQRMNRGESFIPLPVGKYDAEIDSIFDHDKALTEYKDLRDIAVRQLALITDQPEVKDAVCAQVNALSMPSPTMDQVKKEMGEWIVDYFDDNGYTLGESSSLLKNMIKTSFPKVCDRVVTPENVEGRLMRILKILNQYIAVEEQHTNESMKILSHQCH